MEVETHSWEEEYSQQQELEGSYSSHPGQEIHLLPVQRLAFRGFAYRWTETCGSFPSCFVGRWDQPSYDGILQIA